MDHQSMRPYDLGYAKSHNVICARGPVEILDQLVKLDGAQWSGDRLCPESFVYFPISRANIMAAEAVATPATVSPEYKEWRCHFLRAPMAWQADVDQALHEGGWEPRPLLSHQTDFLAHCGRLHPRSAFNASEQGTGKTTCGWLWLQLNRSKRALIVCPKSLCREWQREWGEVWNNGQPIDCIVWDSGSTKSRAEWIARYRSKTSPIAVIINYEVLDALQSAIREFQPDAVIFDESWRIKNHEAKVTKAAINISDLCDHVLLLTGTPIGNDIGDLWSQLRCCGRDLMPENYFSFLHRYATLRPMQLGPRTVHKPVGVADPVGLMERLERVWYRATKAACLDLPPKRYDRPQLFMEEGQLALYEALIRDGEVALGNDLSLAGDITIDLRKHQICGGFAPTYNSETGEMAMVPLADCPKIAWLRQFAEDRLKGNPSARCIVWAAYTHELRRITEELNRVLGAGKAVMCWGGSDNDEIEQWKHSFKSRSATGVQVLVCQLKKMAFGHNLQEADYNVYFSNSWSYVVRSQSEDRSHRNGRADAVHYFDLALDGSIDQEVMDALDHKRDFATRLAPATVSRADREVVEAIS